MTNKKGEKEAILDHQSGVNKDGEPFVQLISHGKVISQMSPKECRDHALATLEAAESAEQDAFLVWFVREKIGGDLNMAGQVLQEFRHYREVQSGIQSGMKVIPPGHAKGEA